MSAVRDGVPEHQLVGLEQPAIGERLAGLPARVDAGLQRGHGLLLDFGPANSALLFCSVQRAAMVRKLRQSLRTIRISSAAMVANTDRGA